jgi:hypothetical protein
MSAEFTGWAFTKNAHKRAPTLTAERKQKIKRLDIATNFSKKNNWGQININLVNP